MSYYSDGSEEYYEDPFSSKPVGDTEIADLLKNLGVKYPTNSNSNALKPTVSTGSSGAYSSDPFLYEGKLVKFSRFFVENIEVQQNSGMAGYFDDYQSGRLMAFSVTCNDRDMIPVCYLENQQAARDVINDMSFLEAVQHGRGMTYNEAISTYKVDSVDQSRDVSGQRLSLFPYVTRFKDTVSVGASNMYDDYKGTADDKCYVMNYEPGIYPPYRRLYFDVINNSKEGPRLVNRLEIKRLIYVDPDSESVTKDISTEFTQFNTALVKLKEQLNNPSSVSSFARTDEDDVIERFINLLKSKLNDNNNVTKARFSRTPNYYVDDVRTQLFRNELAKRIQGEAVQQRTHQRSSKNNKSEMRIKFG